MNSSGMSIATRSTGSSRLPSTSFVSTSGLPTVSSKPSRRINSTRIASCNSPRPCTSHASGRSVGRTRKETLPTSSASRRCFTWLAVSRVPSVPARGLVLIPIVTDKLGSSTAVTGSGRGSSGSAIVSPIVTSGSPAIATISPGPASSAGTRSSASVTYSSVMRAFSTVPSARHHAICCPFFRRQIAWCRAICCPFFRRPCRIRHGRLKKGQQIARHHAICRLKKGQQIAWCRADGTVENARITELYVTEALDRVPAEEAGPGEIVAIAGLPDVTIGETIADPDDPRPLPVSTVDEPSLSITIGINTSPLAGTEGDRLTASMVKQRLEQELVGNVSLRVNPTARPDAWEVQGRGELQLAVLVELMRREGFELTVGKPEVLTRDIDGKTHEPVERVAIDVPEEYIGVVTQLLALRKGSLQQMVNHGTGWARMEYLVPARGLIGFRTEFLTETRGTGILHHVFEGWEPWHGELRTRPTGALVSDRRGAATSFAILNLQERGSLFISPGIEVYEGMIVGENARDGDLDVNAAKPKKLTNMRAASADILVRLIPARKLSLEQVLEFIRVDEAIEVMPHAIGCGRLS